MYGATEPVTLRPHSNLLPHSLPYHDLQRLLFEWFFFRYDCFSKGLQSTILGDYLFNGLWLPGSGICDEFAVLSPSSFQGVSRSYGVLMGLLFLWVEVVWWHEFMDNASWQHGIGHSKSICSFSWAPITGGARNPFNLLQPRTSRNKHLLTT